MKAAAMITAGRPTPGPPRETLKNEEKEKEGIEKPFADPEKPEEEEEEDGNDGDMGAGDGEEVVQARFLEGQGRISASILERSPAPALRRRPLRRNPARAARVGDVR